jgi:hypothetical protein
MIPVCSYEININAKRAYIYNFAFPLVPLRNLVFNFKRVTQLMKAQLRGVFIPITFKGNDEDYVRGNILQ